MSKYRIRFFSDYGTGDCHRKAYESFCRANLLKNYGPDKEIYITDGDDYTHVVILNIYMPNIGHIPKQNVIGLAMEPPQFMYFSPEFREYAKKHIGKYFLGDCEMHGLGEPFVEHFGFVGHQPPNYMIPLKPNLMSIMISDKRFAPGHIYRHQIAEEILKSDLPIDIFGRGCQFYSQSDPRIKGGFTSEKDMLDSYKFNICIENHRSNHYFSEKAIDPLAHSATPIYLGCYNIESYFPECYIHLTGYLEKDMELIRDIVAYPEKYRTINNVEQIFEKINLLKNLDTIFAPL
jgi:hypothetical protein